MGRTTKLTISLPKELVSFANELARKKKISRSKVVSSCLRELAETYRATEMAEGYAIIAEEQKQFAATASKIEHEVIPDWK